MERKQNENENENDRTESNNSIWKWFQDYENETDDSPRENEINPSDEFENEFNSGENKDCSYCGNELEFYQVAYFDDDNNQIVCCDCEKLENSEGVE